MATTVNTTDLSWQSDYAAQLKRTSGYTATFGHHGNGWWTLYVDGKPGYRRNRKSEIIQMTANLEKRPDATATTKDTPSA